MQFQIPQFIEIEDKIVGPLTLKQFLYLAGAAAVSFVLFFILQYWLWLIITIFLGAIGVSLAFIKYNGRPLPAMLWKAFIYFWRPRLYIWRREAEFREFREVEIKGRRFEIPVKAPNVKKLWRDLMTTKSPIPKREKIVRMPSWEKGKKERFQIFRKITGEKEVARRVDYR